MKDRVPLYPGRVKLTPVSGQENTYDMFRADEPTQEGDPLSKATFLKDATAALFGLDITALPDDVLAFLGRYNLYWWKIRTYAQHYEARVSETVTGAGLSAPYSGTTIFYYSDSISVSQSDGTISLVNPQSVEIYWGNTGGVESFTGKYVCSGTYQNLSSVFKFGDSGSWNVHGGDSVITMNFSGTRDTIIGFLVVETGEWYFDCSENAEAHPHFGIVDGYEYVYLGIPFSNVLSAAKIEVGSYIGTGTYGKSNPCSLSFGFAPKIVIILPYIIATYSNSASLPVPYFDTTIYQNTAWEGNTFTWYQTENTNNDPATWQCNAIGKEYFYIAIG